MPIKAIASFSATGCTVVEPASVISPDRPSEFGGVVVGDVVIEVFGDVVGIVVDESLHPTIVIAKINIRPSDNKNHLFFFMYFSFFVGNTYCFHN
jgi:hypothetical protein